uniref:DUF834 domain-containing protein n=1 Tax=Oryza glumipatula TaxID=40148 RepID=A0A0E0BEY0_9ORYZ
MTGRGGNPRARGREGGSQVAASAPEVALRCAEAEAGKAARGGGGRQRRRRTADLRRREREAEAEVSGTATRRREGERESAGEEGTGGAHPAFDAAQLLV